MTSAMVSVFAWRHQGRREMLFLEWSRPGTPCMQGQCHFLRVTRNGFYRMGHEGQWQLRLSGEGPVLDLLNFRCEAYYCIRVHPLIRFTYQAHDPLYMRDGEGRRIRYLGRCTLGWCTARCIMMQVPVDSDPSLEFDEDDWVLVRLEP